MAISRDVQALLNQLEDAEQRFARSEFLAPVLRRGAVHVRIAGVVCRFTVDPNFEGWGIFRPTGPATAQLVRAASLSERRRYLEPLTRHGFILCHRDRHAWLAWPAHGPDQRFPGLGLVPLLLVQEAQRFDQVSARFDGVQSWFEEPDHRGDPAAAQFLRDALHQKKAPDHVRRLRLTTGLRTAYALAYGFLLEAERDRTEDRLRTALGHAGAELVGHVKRADGYRVGFRLDGARHVSMVAKTDLTLRTAGICLSGEDGKFDLHSLTGLLPEARDEGVLA